MNDAQLQSSLARMMLTGVLVAAAIMGAGLIWFVVTHEGMPPGDHVFSGEPKYFENPVWMLQRALDLNAVGHRRSLIMIGVVLLLINPARSRRLCSRRLRCSTRQALYRHQLGGSCRPCSQFLLVKASEDKLIRTTSLMHE